jgi:hypothetical protein
VQRCDRQRPHRHFDERSLWHTSTWLLRT